MLPPAGWVLPDVSEEKCEEVCGRTALKSDPGRFQVSANEACKETPGIGNQAKENSPK